MVEFKKFFDVELNLLDGKRMFELGYFDGKIIDKLDEKMFDFRIGFEVIEAKVSETDVFDWLVLVGKSSKIGDYLT